MTGHNDRSHPAPQAGHEVHDQPTNRWVAILYVVFCFEMGVFLFMLPWVSLWNENFFVAHYPWISTLAKNYFLRGAVSGLGLADLFLAFHEVWRLRRVLGLVSSRPSR